MIDTAKYDQYTTVNEAYRAMLVDYERTLEIIAREFAREAVNREWCSEFEAFVKHVNEMLPHPLVTHVDVPVKISVTVHFQTTLAQARIGGDLEEAFYNRLNSDGVSLHDFMTQTAKRLMPDAAYANVDVEVRER